MSEYRIEEFTDGEWQLIKGAGGDYQAVFDASVVANLHRRNKMRCVKSDGTVMIEYHPPVDNQP